MYGANATPSPECKYKCIDLTQLKVRYSHLFTATNGAGIYISQKPQQSAGLALIYGRQG
jgi:hypothetical protein